jgi:hypothetical protein
MCSLVASASHTFLSGKVNELISLLVDNRNAATGRAD